MNGRRRLPIIIGGFEAQAIAIEIEKMTPTRPLTHDLFKSFAQSFSIQIQEVIIYNLVDGIFYAKLICIAGSKQKLEFDARPSDAIALAVRFDCPIFTYEFILATAGIVVEGNDFAFLGKIEGQEDQAEVTSGSKTNLSQLSDEELKKQLKDSLNEEAYERAARIRDELSKRRGSN